MSYAHAPTQAAEFSGPGKLAIVLYAPDWAADILSALAAKPTAYEAGWRFHEPQRAHVLEVEFPDSLAPTLRVALVDGIHSAVLAALARGSALVLSPYPLYRDPPDQEVAQLFDPDQALALPDLPNPLA